MDQASILLDQRFNGAPALPVRAISVRFGRDEVPMKEGARATASLRNLEPAMVLPPGGLFFAWSQGNTVGQALHA